MCTRLQVGEVFLIVDAGGGTIDFTMHEVLDQAGNKVLGEATHRAMLLDVSGPKALLAACCLWQLPAMYSV